jgi:hypothetical protein
MRTIPRFLGFLLAIAAALLAHTARSSEMEDDFAWFNSLGYPDVKGLAFIRYVDGWTSSAGDTEMKPE